MIGRSVSRIAGKLFSYGRLLSIPTSIFLPFYHVVSDEDLHYRHNYHYRSIAQFEKELEFFLKHFKPVSLDYLLSYPNSSEKVFHLSFDDGLKECAEIIAPILLKKGIPATFFINPDFIDNRALFHRYKASLVFDFLQKKAEPSMSTIYKTYNLDTASLLKAEYSLTPVLDEIATLLGIDFDKHLREEKPYMISEQLKYMSEQGFAIGAHSMNHPEFWKISEDEQYRQVKDSVKWVKNMVNPKINTFSFPFTDDGVSAKTIARLKEEKICDLTFGTAGIKYDSIPNHFQRYPVEQEGDFKMRIKEEWVYFYLRKIFHKETVHH